MLWRLSALPHQATTKIPGRERNQSTATTRVLNLEARTVHTTISVVVTVSLVWTISGIPESSWLRMLQLQVTIVRECWGEAWFHVLLDVHGKTKLESPTSTPLPPRQTRGMRKLHHAKNVSNWSCLVQAGKFRVQSFWATATKFDHLHSCREALAW